MDTNSKILNGMQFLSQEHIDALQKDQTDYDASVEKNQSTPGHKFKWERFSAGTYRSCCGHEISDNGKSGQNKYWYDRNGRYFNTLNEAKNYAHDSHVNEFKGKPTKG